MTILLLPQIVPSRSESAPAGRFAQTSESGDAAADGAALSADMEAGALAAMLAAVVGVTDAPADEAAAWLAAGVEGAFEGLVVAPLPPPHATTSSAVPRTTKRLRLKLCNLLKAGIYGWSTPSRAIHFRRNGRQ